jgi:hypothetical protein
MPQTLGKTMSDYSTLVSAISDVGYWRWWSERLPERFQLEFGGVQIYMPPKDKTQLPSGLLALRFLRPSSVSFIRRTGAGDGLPSDWPRQLKDEKLKPFSVSYEEFALGDDSLFDEVVGQIESEIVYFTDALGGKNVKLAFWAGNAGIRIEAAEIRPVLMSGEVPLSAIDALHENWWLYWRDYWMRRETAEALPKDYACEVTIPLEQE